MFESNHLAWLIACDWAVLGIASGKTYIVNRNDDRVCEVSIEELAILRIASKPSTVKDLVACAHSGPANAGGGGRQLSKLVPRMLRRGLLRWIDDALRNAPSSDGEAHGRSSLEIAVWPTRNRRHAILRSLSSYLEHSSRWGHLCPAIVIDDTESAHERSKLRRDVYELARHYGGRIFYLSPWESPFFDRVIERAEENGVPREVAQFAFSGTDSVKFRLGANRNCVLAATAGRRVLTCDDDVRMEPYVVDDSWQSLAIGGYDRHAEWFDASTRDGVLQRVPGTASDIILAHERVLGYRIDKALESWDHEFDPSDLTPTMLRRIEREGHVVVATCAGFYGDSGVDEAWALLPSRSGDQTYKHTRLSRQRYRRMRSVVVTDDARFVPLCAGISNDRFLPPFFPVGRGSDDVVYGALLGALYPAPVAHLPDLVYHDASLDRSYDESDLRFNTRLADLIHVSILGISADESFRGIPSVEERTRVLGSRLREFASQPRREFVAAIGSLWSRRSVGILKELARVRDSSPGSPPSYREDLDRAIDSISEAVSQGEPAMVPDELSTLSRDEAFERVAMYTDRYGELLLSWDVLRAMAVETLKHEDW